MYGNQIKILQMDSQNLIGFIIFGSLSLWLIIFPKYFVKSYLWIVRKKMKMPSNEAIRFIGLFWLLILSFFFIYKKK